MSRDTDGFSEALAAYQRASWPVLNNLDVWRDELASDEARLMAWPRPLEGTRFEKLLAILFNADVQSMLALLTRMFKGEPVESFGLLCEVPANPSAADPGLQVVLRVVQRAADAGAAAMVREFGGAEVTGRREYVNRVKTRLVDEAVRSGLPRDEAFARLGLSRASAYRSMRRRMPSKG